MGCKPKCLEEDSFEDVQGNLVCSVCGIVSRGSKIVSDLQFFNNKPVGHFYRQSTFEVRHRNGLGLIQSIGMRLSVSGMLIGAAKRYYKSAWEKNSTRGRPTIEVAAVCLYIACRVDWAPLMLIDFQDAVRVNVFRLGSVYLAISRALYIDIPAVDPSLYLPRFCSKLLTAPGITNAQKFQVVQTGLKILQQMNREWMFDGKRPNGLCGAAVLVAARCHGFKVSVSNASTVSHVCPDTIRRHLNEFKGTESATMTLQELAALRPPESLPRAKNVHCGQIPAEVGSHALEQPAVSRIPEGIDIPLSDTEDETVNAMILTPEESRIKKHLWNAMNRDWLIAQKEKRRIRREGRKARQCSSPEGSCAPLKPKQKKKPQEGSPDEDLEVTNGESTAVKINQPMSRWEW